jgi:GTP cyclohydrolase IA
MDKDKIEHCVKEILTAIGEDPEREGIRETPKRVARMYEEIFHGMKENPDNHLKTYFNEMQSGDIVLVSDIDFYSLCEHHMLPFFGRVHIAYIPNNGKILGLSKFGRTVEVFSRRLQVQERLTSQIAKIIMDKAQAQGVYVILEAEHMCMTMRGLKKQGSRTTTSVALGEFLSNDFLKTKVISLINARK